MTRCVSLLALAGAWLLAGCTVPEPDVAGVEFGCEQGSCPSGQSCVDGRCYADGEAPGEGDGDAPAEGGGEAGDGGGGGVEGEGEGAVEGEGGGGAGEGEGEGAGPGDDGDPPAGAETLSISGPGEEGVGAGVEFSVTVRLLDAQGAPVSEEATVTVAASQAGEPVELLGVASVSAEQGVATFEGLSLQSAGDATTLRATADGIGAVDSDPFPVVPGDAVALMWAEPPPDRLTAGEGPELQVFAEDPYGNPTATGWNEVSLTATVDGEAAPVATSQAFAAQGAATFPGLELRRAAPAVELVASSVEPGIAEATATVAVDPGPARALGFLRPPPHARPGQPLTPAVAAGVFDAFGNRVLDGETRTLTLSLHVDPTGGAFVGVPDKTAEDTWEFPLANIAAVGVGFELQVSGAGLDPATSAPFAVANAGAPLSSFTLGAVGGDDALVDVAMDDEGGFVVVGSVQGEVTLGDRQLTVFGDKDLVVARYGPDRELQWARTLGGPGADEAVAVAWLGEQGDVRVLGKGVGEVETSREDGRGASLDLGSEHAEGFVATWSADGVPESIWRATSAEAETGVEDMACTGRRSCYVVGTLKRITQFGPDNRQGRVLTPHRDGSDDGFVAAFDDNGAASWAQLIGGRRSSEAARGVAAAADGGAWVTGQIQAFGADPAHFGQFEGQVTVESTDGIDAFAVRLSSLGAVGALAVFGGPGTQEGYAIAAHPENGAVVAGTYRGDFEIQDRFEFHDADGTATFLVSLDRGGVADWAQGLQSDGSVQPGGLAWGDSAGDLPAGPVLSGVHALPFEAARDRAEAPPLQVGAGPLVSGHVLRFDGRNGDAVWAAVTHCDGNFEPGGVVASGRLVVATTEQQCSLRAGVGEEANPDRDFAGDVTLTAIGSRDGAALVLDPSTGGLRKGLVVGGGGNDGVAGVLALEDGDFVALGLFEGDAHLGVDEAGDPASAQTSGSADGLVARYGRQGVLRWRHIIGGDGIAVAARAVELPGGGIATAGLFRGGTRFGLGQDPADGGLGETPVGGLGYMTPYVTRLDGDGQLQWVRTVTSDGFMALTDIVLTSDGGTLIVGGMALADGITRFGPRDEDAFAGSGGFLVSYSAEDGTVTRLVQLGFEGLWSVDGMAASADGGVFVAGQFYETAPLPNDRVREADGFGDGYIVRVDADGELDWIQFVSGGAQDACTALALGEADGDPALYVGGTYGRSFGEDTTQFGRDGEIFTTLSGEDSAFFARLDPADGSFVWVRPILSDGGKAKVRSFAARADELAFVAEVEEETRFDPDAPEDAVGPGEITFEATGKEDAVIGVLRPSDGRLRWLQAIRATPGREISAGELVYLRDGSLLLGGGFSGEVTIEGGGGVPGFSHSTPAGSQGLLLRMLP